VRTGGPYLLPLPPNSPPGSGQFDARWEEVPWWKRWVTASPGTQTPVYFMCTDMKRKRQRPTETQQAMEAQTSHVPFSRAAQ
jgi:hypothetical protein